MIKKIFIYTGIIFFITFIIWGVSILDIWIAVNSPDILVFMFPLTIAVIIFIIGYFSYIKIAKVDKIKSEFITVAAHRLRTPLSRINWMLEELSTDVSADVKSKLIESMKDVVSDFTSAVNQLLDATEAGKKSLYYDYLFEKGGIGSIIQQVIADYTVGIIQKNIKVTTNIQEALPSLSIDKDRMKIAISIFIENAIMYTQEGGNINISLYEKGENIIFSIKDTGIGISKESLPYVYTKFFRAKEAVTIDRDRTGLGLFIAEEIIKKHGGSVEVESEGINKGSIFEFYIPIR